MISPDYKPLSQEKDPSISCEDDFDTIPLRKPEQAFLSKKFFIILVAALASSITLNAVFLFQKLIKYNGEPSEPPTPFAGVLKDQTVGFTHESPFTSPDRKVQGAAWRAPELNPELGLVALSEDLALSKGLPESQVWPWDLKKRIYLLNGFHSMHCVHALRVTIHQAYDHLTPTIPEGHMLHCLDVLREEIMCSADDTPRYTGRLHSEVGKKVAVSGNGQTRTCRNWNALVDWAVENSACYKYVNKTDIDFPELERYKYCPDGRVHWSE